MGDQYMKFVEEELELVEQRFSDMFKECIESVKQRIRARVESCSKDGCTMTLELRNGIAPTILTGEEIKGEGDAPIEVALVDDVTGDVVVDEPEASAKINFYLVNVSGAEELIVPQEEGKLPILAGNAPLQLRRGVAEINNLKIRNNATKIKPPVFKLGARVIGASGRVKEAKTEPFTLKDFRNKYFRKHENPSLLDEVSRLVCIRKGGIIHKRLQENNIFTVEDFLIRLLIDRQNLKSIVKTSAKMWKAIVDNAQACQSSDRVYCYIDPKQKREVAFNILGRVLELCSGSHCSQISTLSEKHEVDELLESALCNWKEVKVFDDLNSLHQYLYDKTENSLKGAAMAYPDDLQRKPDPPYESEGATAPSFPLLDLPPTALGAQSFQSVPLLDLPPTALGAQSFQSVPLLDLPPTAMGAQSFQSVPLLDLPPTALGAQSFQTTATHPSFPLLDPPPTALGAQSFQTTATALGALSFQTTNYIWENFAFTDDEISTLFGADDQ
ncbi:calmodulin-binding protein 60 B-like [Salvia divinorum]|uniref:Calmodulin-binding protein 60 B-like n=1 Tax=Salvia divinorum TaxID=28513 RepID=A0ABD1IBZ1_SALDI